jgi:hypothetical protein
LNGNGVPDLLIKVCDRRNCITSKRRLEEKTMRIATLAVVAALGAAAFAGAAAAQPTAATPSYPATASDYDYGYRFGLPPNAFAGQCPPGTYWHEGHYNRWAVWQPGYCGPR